MVTKHPNAVKTKMNKFINFNKLAWTWIHVYLAPSKEDG